MKIKRAYLNQIRKDTDNKLLKSHLNELTAVSVPRKGWIKVIRESLGISTRQLSAILNVTSSSIVQIEAREITGAVTLEKMSEIAKAMNCKFVYAIVPETSLEKIIDEKATTLAKKIVNKVSHTMALENQKVDQDTTDEQIKELSDKLKRKLDKRLWSKK